MTSKFKHLGRIVAGVAAVVLCPTFSAHAQPIDPVPKPAASPEPKPEIEAPSTPVAPKVKSVTQQDLRQATRAFVDAAICKHCNGAGKVTRNKIIGKEPVSPGRVGPARLVRPVGKEVEVKCPDCDGLAIANSSFFVSKGELMVRNMDVIAGQQHDQKMLEALDITRDALRKLASYGSSLQTRLNDRVITKLSSNREPANEPLILVATLDSDSGAGGSRTTLVSFADNARHLIMDDPLIVDATKGDIVLIGGVFDHHEAVGGDPSGGRLRHGFVVKITDFKAAEQAGVGEESNAPGAGQKRRRRGHR